MMISAQFFNIVSKALPRARYMQSAGELLLIDRNAKIIGQVNFQDKGITVFKEYKYCHEVALRLQSATIPVEVRELDMTDAMNILYNKH